MSNEVSSPEDWEIVQQVEQYTAQTVPVEIRGITAVYALPAKRSVMRAFHVPEVGNSNHDGPIEVVPGDRRIKRVWFQAATTNPGAIYLGTQEQVNLAPSGKTDAFFYDGSEFFGPLEGFQEAVYAFALTGGAVNILSVRLEYWAD